MRTETSLCHQHVGVRSYTPFDDELVDGGDNPENVREGTDP